MASVLVVDDHLDSCQMLVLLIGRFNGPAECVGSGPELLRILQTRTPQLVFLDWMMPDMTGLEVLRAIRADPRTTALPVVMFSALSDPAYRAIATEAGADDYIVKGEFKSILAAVKRYVQ